MNFRKLSKWISSPAGILFFLVLTLAGAFRIILMQYVEFKGDEALNLFLATRPLFHHPFPPASQASSAGILNFPLINYLLFPIVIFTTYPPSVSFVIALLNVFTVGGFFLLFKKYHGKLTAFISSAILALSPWAILYSRKIWEQDFILPLSLPFFWSVYEILNGKKKFWLLFGLSSMLLIQIHQLTGLIPLFIFFWILIGRKPISWKYLIIGGLIGLIPTIPYFCYMAQNFCITCHNTSIAGRFMFHDPSGFLRPLQIISIGNFHVELGNDFAIFATRFRIPYLFSKATYLAYILLPISLVFFWLKNNTQRFLIPVSLLPVLLYFLIGIEPLMHYYIILIPLFALFVGYLLSWGLENKKFKFIFILITIAYLGGLFAFNYGIFAFLLQKGGFAGDYGGGFITGEKGTNDALKKFTDNANYRELVITYPTPLNLFQGYMPVGKMIYPHEDLRKQEAQLEKQFLLSPNDPILQRIMLAYYTQEEDPSWNYVVSLKEKIRAHSEFTYIYQTVLENYLEKHLKNLYETPDFLLLYPRHWYQKPIDNGVVLSEGTIAVTITELPIGVQTEMKSTNTSLFFQNQKILGLDCIQNGNWCGTSYQPIFLRSHYYTVEISPIEGRGSKEMETMAKQNMQEIINSIHTLK